MNIKNKTEELFKSFSDYVDRGRRMVFLFYGLESYKYGYYYRIGK